MEDEFIVACGGRMSAVFDGHGGHTCAEFLRDNLHRMITESAAWPSNLK